MRVLAISGSLRSGSLNSELLRLAFPRRVYTQSHVDYLAEVILYVNSIKDSIRGVRIASAPEVLRHFSARMEMVEGNWTV